MKFKLILNGAVLMCWPLLLHGGGQTEVSPPFRTNVLSLDWVISQVLSNNPSLKSSRASWLAMKHKIAQARAWEDLKFGVDVERFGTTRPFTYTDTEWMISQELPLSGKNRLRAKSAAADADAVFAELRRKELDLVAGATAAYFRLANAHVQSDLNRKNLSLWQQFAELTRAKYEVGAQSQADLLLAETELARVEEVLVDNGRQISDVQSRLNVLMNRRVYEAMGPPVIGEPVALRFSFESLQTSAQSHRPEFQASERRIRSAKARVALAKKEWIPDPEFRVEARQFNGTGRVVNEYDTGVFFKFPWFNRGRYTAGINEAKAMQESAEEALEALLSETAGLIRDHLKKVESYHHHYELFRNKLLPLAGQTVNAKRISYESDKAGFLELLMAQKTVQEIESMAWNHLADYHIAVSELEAVIGAPIETADPTTNPVREETK